MRLAATCNYGLSSILKNEIVKLGFHIYDSDERLIRFEGNFEAIALANLSLRTANRVYIEVATGLATDFDALYSKVLRGEWREILPESHPVTIRAVTDKSPLSSLPAIQKTTKKAIAESVTGSKLGILPEDPELPETSVLVLARGNQVLILLDTSGDPLHKRGYRIQGVEAPIKETLAAGLILLSGWRFSEPFHDPFCGSGTFALEAAMIAKNIAPGLNRNFAFERFPFAALCCLDRIRKELISKEMRDKPHTISGSDSDAEAVTAARSNAAILSLADSVSFTVASYPQTKIPFEKGTVVTNPPYGERLSDRAAALDSTKLIFQAFERNKNLSGGVITSLEEAASMGRAAEMKDRKIPNGPIPCRYYFRMPERSSKPGNKPKRA